MDDDHDPRPVLDYARPRRPKPSLLERVEQHIVFRGLMIVVALALAAAICVGVISHAVGF